MIKELNLFRNIIPTKTIIPVLNHIHFYDGRIQGNDGSCYFDTASGFEYDITVPFEKLRKAYELLGEPSLEIKDDFLILKHKRSRIKLGIYKEIYPSHKINTSVSSTYLPDLYNLLKNLRPFIAEDASRPWAQSINITDGFGYATNNVSIVRQKTDIPNMVIPIHLIDKLLMLLDEDTDVSYIEDDNFLQFSFNDSYLCGVKLATQWPDVSKLVTISDNLKSVDSSIHASVVKLIPFCNNDKMPFIYFDENGIHTDSGESFASIDIDSFPKAIFRAEVISRVLQLATEIDFSTYPKPCYFKNNDIDGVVLGVSVQ